MSATWIGVGVHILIEAILIVRVMLRPHREPAARIAWVAVIASLPVIGILAYLLFGEVNLGRRRVARKRTVASELSSLPTAWSPIAEAAREVPERYHSLFALGRSISGFDPVGGNSGELMLDSNAAIDAIAADIDAAQHHVHLIFYIWLTDNNGLKIAEALQRAAARGVTCRAIADGLGSRAMIRSRHWRALIDAGVEAAVALPFKTPLAGLVGGRVDLRNHRKIVVIDGSITYCGSQNCADPEFRVKPKFAPWVDVLVRFEGPIAQQNQRLFASDWMTSTKDDLRDALREPPTVRNPGFPAQVIGTGPTARASAMPDLFESLIFAARRELVITTPYYVPNEAMQSALRTAAYRGVDVTLILPARNDSWIVAGASRSNYADLVDAGVKLHEYAGGLLHAKTLVVDGNLALIGSANMDRRSFDLNYENNILFYDAGLAAAVRERQQHYLATSRLVTRESVAAWSGGRRLWNNTLAVVSPIL